MTNKKTIIQFIAVLMILITASITTAWYTNNGDGTYTFGINITQQQASRIVEAYTQVYQYKTVICEDNQCNPIDPQCEPMTCYPNPETKPQFTDRMIQQQIKDTVKKYERKQAIDEIEIEPVPTS